MDELNRAIPLSQEYTRERRNTPIPRNRSNSIQTIHKPLTAENKRKHKFLASSSALEMEYCEDSSINDSYTSSTNKLISKEDDTDDEEEEEEEKVSQLFKKTHQLSSDIFVLEETHSEQMLKWGRNQLSSLHREMITFLQMSKRQVKEWTNTTLPTLELILNDQFKKQLGVELYSTLHQWKYFAIRKAIDEEFHLQSTKQFLRDAFLWYRTLQFPQISSIASILRRIFIALKFGGLIFCPQYRGVHYETQYHYLTYKQFVASIHEGQHEDRFSLHLEDFSTHCNSTTQEEQLIENENPEQWLLWNQTRWPIATALSHGSRVLIQLPKKENHCKEDRDHGFFRWLITGDENGQLAQYMSTYSSSAEAEKQNKIVFKRLAATHGIDYVTEENVEVIAGGVKKFLKETKLFGLNFRNSKFLQSDDKTLHHHRHWALNIPFGGANFFSLSHNKIQTDGTHGHLYIYYQSAAEHRNGGILIGLEGSEASKTDQVGFKHSWKGDSCKYSPSFGYKFMTKPNKESSVPLGVDEQGKVHLDHAINLSVVGGPKKKNSLFVDLSNDWRFLMQKEKEWKDIMVFETSDVPFQS